MAARSFHNPSRISDHRTIGGHIPVDDDRCGTDLAMVADIDGSKQCSIGTDQNMMADGRMSFIPVMPCATQGNPVKQDAVISDLCCFSYNDTGAMVDEKTPANPGSRMNFNAGPESVQHGNHTGKDGDFEPAMQKMCKAVNDDGVQWDMAEQYFKVVFGGRIVFLYGPDVI
jgi:hypothetical protein